MQRSAASILQTHLWRHGGSPEASVPQVLSRLWQHLHPRIYSISLRCSQANVLA